MKMFNIDKIAKNKLFKNSSIFIFGKVIATLSSIFLLPLFTKNLSQQDFGIIGILWLIQPILSRVMNMGADVAVKLKYFKVSKEEYSNKLYHTFSITLFMFLIFLLSLGICYKLGINIIDQSLPFSIASIFLTTILMKNVVTIFLKTLVLCDKPKFNVVVSVILSIITTVITYFLVIYIDTSYRSYIIAMFISNFIFSVIGMIWLLNNFKLRYFRFKFKEIKKQLKVGLPVVPSTIGIMILTAGDRLIIKYFIGMEAVALYTYGYKFCNSLSTSIVQPFQKALGPIVLDKAAKDFNNAALYIKKLGDIMIKYFPILVAVAIIPARQVMLFLSTETYNISYYVFLIALPGIVIMNIMNIYMNIFNHLERTDLDMKMVLIGAFTNVILNILVIPKYGIIAASVTTTISYFLMFLMSIILLNKFIENKIKLKIILRVIPFLIYILTIIIIDVSIDSVYLTITYKFFLFLIFAYFQYKYNGKKIRLT